MAPRGNGDEAWEYDRYGDLSVLVRRAVRVPAPGPGRILVRVRAAALNPKDSLVRKGRFRAISGRSFPKRTGLDFAGEIAAVGRGVVGHAIGERVFGALEELTATRGTLADHVECRPEELARAPRRLSMLEAAALPLAATTALQALRDLAVVGPGMRVLIHGASGGVGTVAIPLARWLGAHVTTTSSAGNRALCEGLGADVTLDHAEPPFAGGAPLAEIGPFDAIFDVFGNLSFARVRPVLRGTFVSTVPSLRIVLDQLRTVGRRGPRARLVLVRARTVDFAIVADLADRGLLRPTLDRVVPFADVPAAFRALETKKTRGKIVIDLGAR